MNSVHSPLPALPPYIYGREAGANEKVWPEDRVESARIYAVKHALRQLPILTAEAVVVGLFDDVIKVALVKRGNPDEPDFGKYAMPGGLVQVAEDKDTTAAVRRLLKGSLGVKPSYLEQAFTESGPSRDSRGWSSAVVHLALYPADALQALADADKVKLVPVWPRAQFPEDIASDHEMLVLRAVQILVDKASYSTIAAHFLPKVFTMTDLHRACEVVCRRKANSANFRRKVLNYDVLQERETLHSFGRPAQGYKLKRDIAYFDKQIL